MAWTRAIYRGQYKRYGLTGGGTLTPYILIVKQAAAQIDSHCGIKIQPWRQAVSLQYMCSFEGRIFVEEVAA